MSLLSVELNAITVFKIVASTHSSTGHMISERGR